MTPSYSSPGQYSQSSNNTVGFKEITALSELSIIAASCDAPPPIEYPETEKLSISISPYKGDPTLLFSCRIDSMASISPSPLS